MVADPGTGRSSYPVAARAVGIVVGEADCRPVDVSRHQGGDSAPALEVCTLLLADHEDLIHKATGWMLREVGKRVDRADLLGFLDEHAAVMPRTMLRYSIEHLSPAARTDYLAAAKG
jgi:DNA alkylation repair enzyme